MAGIFEFGFREFARLRQSAGAADQLLEGSRRAMRVAQLKEIDRLEHNLATLATVGSTSPYVGLFGTVWGIMSAFSSLGNVQQATLAQVAPGISEALVATAFGLFAAIPAVVAYNRFADQVTRLEMRFDAFIEEFSTILQRHAARGAGGNAGAGSSAGTTRGALGHGADLTRTAADGRDQRRALHRCHAGVADHIHDHRAAADPGRQGRPAQGRRGTSGSTAAPTPGVVRGSRRVGCT